MNKSAAAKHQPSGENPEKIDVEQIYHANGVELKIINPGRLQSDFDFTRGTGLGTGLELVKSLLPWAGTRLHITHHGTLVTARLNLCYPLIQNIDDE